MFPVRPQFQQSPMAEGTTTTTMMTDRPSSGRRRKSYPKCVSSADGTTPRESASAPHALRTVAERLVSSAILPPTTTIGQDCHPARRIDRPPRRRAARSIPRDADRCTCGQVPGRPVAAGGRRGFINCITVRLSFSRESASCKGVILSDSGFFPLPTSST